MHKSLIAGAAVLASVLVLAAVLFVTRTRDALEPAGAAPASAGSPASSAPSDAFEPLSAPSTLAAPDAEDHTTKMRATARADRPAPKAASRPLAPPAPGAVRICGRVEQPGGAPAAEARVALFSNVAGEPGRSAIARARADGSGAFCIDADEPRELILLACADGLEPLTRMLERPAQAETDLGALRLATGATITGRASCEGQRLWRAEMAAVLDSPLDTIAIDDGFVKWIHQRFAWSFVITDSDVDGSYSISGLAPEAYKVRISSLRGRQAVLGFQSSAYRDVVAPASGVDFDLDAATQRVTFRHEGRPMGGVEAQLESSGVHLTATSDAEGTCEFKLTPRLDANLTASLTGYKVVRMPITGVGAGEQRTLSVDLEVFHPPATVIFDLVPPGDARVHRARFAFYESDAPDGKASFVKEVDLKSPQMRRAPRNVGPRDEFDVGGIPAGVYHVVVQGGDLVGYASTPLGNTPYCEYCDADAVVSVPATGEVRQSVSLVPRSTLQLAARDRSGHGLAAHAKLFDLRGEPLEMSLAAHRNGIWQTLTALDENDYTTVRSILCNGSADLELSFKGYRSKRVKVTFEGQRSLPIDVTLDAE